MSLLVFDELEPFVLKASRYTASRYTPWGISQNDAAQEMWLWLLQHEDRARRWLTGNPPQTTRLYRSLLDVGVSLGEIEKAAHVGYETSDLAWYSPGLVVGLLPLALDETYDGMDTPETNSRLSNSKPPEEGGDLLAMVCDIRRALDLLPAGTRHLLRDFSTGVPGYDEAVQRIVDILGGDKPHIGKRRIVSNAQAQSELREQESA